MAFAHRPVITPIEGEVFTIFIRTHCLFFKYLFLISSWVIHIGRVTLALSFKIEIFISPTISNKISFSLRTPDSHVYSVIIYLITLKWVSLEHVVLHTSRTGCAQSLRTEGEQHNTTRHWGAHGTHMKMWMRQQKNQHRAIFLYQRNGKNFKKEDASSRT